VRRRRAKNNNRGLITGWLAGPACPGPNARPARSPLNRDTALPAFLDPQHLHVLVMHVSRQCAWLLLLAVIFLPLEWLFAVRPGNSSARALPRMWGITSSAVSCRGFLLAVPLSPCRGRRPCVRPLAHATRGRGVAVVATYPRRISGR